MTGFILLFLFHFHSRQRSTWDKGAPRRGQIDGHFLSPGIWAVAPFYSINSCPFEFPAIFHSIENGATANSGKEKWPSEKPVLACPSDDTIYIPCTSLSLRNAKRVRIPHHPWKMAPRMPRPMAPFRKFSLPRMAITASMDKSPTALCWGISQLNLSLPISGLKSVQSENKSRKMATT